MQALGRVHGARLISPKSRSWYGGHVRKVYSSSGLPEALRLDLSTSNPTSECTTQFATVAVVGYPSAGKSSLMNKIVGGRVAAVSRKVQTTRRRIVGVMTEANAQLAFLDTPGIIERHAAAQLGAERKELARSAWGAVADADLGVFVVDVSRSREHWEQAAVLANEVIQRRPKYDGNVDYEPKGRLLFALNKYDCVRPRSRVLEAAEFFVSKVANFSEVFHESRPFIISAYTGRGVDDVKNALLQIAPKGDFILPPDAGPADFEEVRDTLLEHIIEKLLHRVHQEIPYSCEIENEAWKELPSGDIVANEVIRVVRPSQVPLVVGSGGSNIRFIAEEAAASASEVLGRRIFLRLRVATRKGHRWRQ